MTEYGLALINSYPSFTVAATPGNVGGSRWLAPEIIIPPRKGASQPVMESKAADVFAFAMLAVEVFTGKIPFGEQKNEAVVVRISQGGRPEMPGNAQEVGLTSDMWTLLENCWDQNPNRRPSMGEVVRRWREFVENGGGSIECVWTSLAILAACSVPSPTLMVDLGTHPGQDPHIDNGRGPTQPNLHKGRPFDPEPDQTSFNLKAPGTEPDPTSFNPPSPKASDTERILRRFDQLRCLRSNGEEGPRPPGSRLPSRPQSAGLLRKECRS